MNELNEFQIRLGRINEQKLGRNVEDIGINELTDIRDDYNDLLTDIESFIKSSRLDIDNYEDDELANIIITGNKLKTEIKDNRVDIIVERLVKEKTIVNLNNEREQLSKTELAIADYEFADEDNLSDVERTIKELQNSIPARKNEIDKELDELRYGRAVVPNKIEEVERTRDNGVYVGKHLKPETIEEMERELNETPVLPSADETEENSLVPPVDDGSTPLSSEEENRDLPVINDDEPTNNSLLGGIPPVIPTGEGNDEEMELPNPLDESENETELPPELGEEEEDDLAPIINPSDEESDQEESEEELPPELGDEEDDDDLTPIINPFDIDEDEPLDVDDIEQPKPSIWKKVVAITAALAAALTGLAFYLNHKKGKDADKDIINEDVVQNETEVEEEVPVEDFEKQDEDTQTLTQDQTTNNGQPSQGEPSNGTPTTETPSTGTPSTGTPTKDEEYIPIKLEAGESAYDMETGVEITSDGTAYHHENTGVTELEQRDLETDTNGYAVVEESDFKDTTPAPQPMPNPVEEVVSADYHVQDLIDQGQTQEADNFEAAAAEINWDEVFSQGPTL